MDLAGVGKVPAAHGVRIEMNFAPGARIVVTIFGVLGLGIQARILLSPRHWSEVAPLWEIASPLQKLGIAGVMAVPVCFYAFCIVTCFVRLPKPVLFSCTGIVAMTAVPFFLAITDEDPGLARNAAFTGLPWIFVLAEQVYAKPTQSVTSATHADPEEMQEGPHTGDTST